MIDLIINGTSVNLKDGQSLTYVDYNSLFDAEHGQGSYTYDIDIDLRDPVNAKMYKHLNRINTYNIPTGRTARLFCDGRLIFQGTETILRIEGDTAKIQILCGNSKVNFEGSDRSLGSLDLGTLPTYTRAEAAQTLYGSYPTYPCVCCPVMTTLDMFPYNADTAKFVNMVNPHSIWDETVSILEGQSILPQPYLLYVIEKVFEALGWTVDYNCLREMEYAKHMIVVHGHNTLEVAKMVPNWSVNKFLEEVQKLFNVLFICDDLQNKVSIYSIKEYYESLGEYINIRHDDIVKQDSSPERNLEEEVGYAYNYDLVAYDLPNVTWYNRARLSEGVKKLVNILEFSSVTDFDTETYKNAAQYNQPNVFHAADTDTYWILTKRSPVGDFYHFQRVDMFKKGEGENYVEDETTETTLEIIPAEIYCLDIHPEYSDGHYKLMGAAVPYARNNDQATTEEEATADVGLNEWIDGNLPTDIDTSNDKLFVAQYLGLHGVLWTHSGGGAEYTTAVYPQCAVTRYMSGIYHAASSTRYDGIFDIFYGDDTSAQNLIMDLTHRVQNLYANNEHVDNKQAFKINYRANGRQDVTFFFVINGRKFACVKNEYTIENGHVSPIVKGTFLPYD